MKAFIDFIPDLLFFLTYIFFLDIPIEYIDDTFEHSLTDIMINMIGYTIGSNIWLASDNYSFFGGWMEGALQTSFNAIDQIVKRNPNN